jgi:hypothetical protein
MDGQRWGNETEKKEHKMMGKTITLLCGMHQTEKETAITK